MKNKITKFLIIELLFIILFNIFSINCVHADEIQQIKIDENANNTSLTIYSPIALLMEKSTGKVLYAKNAYNKTYNASTTKLLTAILTVENTDLTDIATVSKTAVNSVPIDYTNCNLQVGEQLTIDDLLHVLLIPSANDAANVLAEHISGSIDNFADLMNKKAKEIGCKNTHFVNPSGIHNDNHYTTAYDLALIGKYAMQYDIIMDIVKETKYTLPATNAYPKDDRIFVTTNSLVNKNFSKYYYANATGLKTGYTEYAKDCIVASASKNNIDLIAVILNSGYTEDGLRQKYLDCHTLFNYGFTHFTSKQLTWDTNIYQYISVPNAPEGANSLAVVPKDNLYAFLSNNVSDTNVDGIVSINNNLTAPIKKGDTVGTLSFTYNNTTYTTDLVANYNIEANNPLGKYIFKILGGFCLLLFFSIIFNHSKETNHKKNKKRKRKSSSISKRNNYHPSNTKVKRKSNHNYYR